MTRCFVRMIDLVDDPAARAREARRDPVLIDRHRRMGAVQRPLPGQQGWAEMPCIFRQSDHP